MDIKEFVLSRLMSSVINFNVLRGESGCENDKIIPVLGS